MDALEAIFIPIGGGGLAAGIAVFVKALKPHIKVRATHTHTHTHTRAHTH